MKKFLLLISVALVTYVNAQQTVGLFTYTQDAYPGYTLFAPAKSEITYLIDNCGDLQFTWQSNYRTGHSVELMENGTLIRACNFANGSPISAGGAGGRIEAIRADQIIDWAFIYANDSVRLHHDFEILPNGNIVMIAWELKTEQEALDAGRDSAKIDPVGIWPEHLIEYDPTNDTIVWEWHAWDHVVQDYDPTKPNYGVVADHPELFDLNFDKGNAASDWQHMNAVDYNAELDQLLLSSPAWSEIYIIDHSTTTAEAASHTGGNSGKGGDILWRWGNPMMYGAGDSTDRMLYKQHDPHWIPSGYRHGGKIIVFNNGKEKSPVEFSTVDIIAPSILVTGEYEMGVTGQFLPSTTDYSYVAPTPTDFYSHNISSADMLPNGNIIIDEGAKGHFFEIDSLDNIVWDYINPVVQDSILNQEEVIPGNSSLFNATFRARRIAFDYPGVTSILLTNQGPIEGNPYPSTCVTQIGLDELSEETIIVYPSPAKDEIHIDGDIKSGQLRITNSLGQIMLQMELTENTIDISALGAGLYYVTISNETAVGQTAFVKK